MQTRDNGVAHHFAIAGDIHRRAPERCRKKLGGAFVQIGKYRVEEVWISAGAFTARLYEMLIGRVRKRFGDHSADSATGKRAYVDTPNIRLVKQFLQGRMGPLAEFSIPGQHDGDRILGPVSGKSCQ